MFHISVYTNRCAGRKLRIEALIATDHGMLVFLFCTDTCIRTNRILQLDHGDGRWVYQKSVQGLEQVLQHWTEASIAYYVHRPGVSFVVIVRGRVITWKKNAVMYSNCAVLYHVESRTIWRPKLYLPPRRISTARGKVTRDCRSNVVETHYESLNVILHFQRTESNVRLGVDVLRVMLHFCRAQSAMHIVTEHDHIRVNLCELVRLSGFSDCWGNRHRLKSQ